MSNRPNRTINPASKLRDVNNTERPALSFHRRPTDTEAVERTPENAAVSTPTNTSVAADVNSVTSDEPAAGSNTNKRPSNESLSENEDLNYTPDPIQVEDSDEVGVAPQMAKRTKKRARKSQDSRSTVDANGMHDDVTVIEIDDDEQPTRKNKSNPTADVKHFFEAVPGAQPNIPSNRSTCLTCQSGKDCVKRDKTVLSDTSTMRRHLEFLHSSVYRKWAKENHFLSMLPKDSSARRVAEQEALKQTSVNDHFTVQKPEDKPIAYSDEFFKEAALQWLIETDQPIHALENKAFRAMIQIAARATRSVHVPNRYQTRAAIINTFKKQMKALKDRLNSGAVSGGISLTCDAWQASNTDGYFAVTAHWIEERSPKTWKLESAIIGFTQMNTAHDGVRLGQALFKVCDRLDIVERISHVTSDNAANNITMMEEFARLYEEKTGRPFDVKKRHIRCLAHIINLATQALISTRSKSKYFNPHSDEEHMPDVNGVNRDEVGLVRAICVKARSSSQRKELFKIVQKREGLSLVLQLLLDMKVRWSSTYVMLNRAESRKTAVNAFVLDLAYREPNLEKRSKIMDLRLTDEEWERVSTFCDLLGFADQAQQAFSAAKFPTLYNALPAVEVLYAAWDKRQGPGAREKYRPFREAIAAANEKLDQYYHKTAESDAHILAMALHPGRKMAHFRKHWDADLEDDVLQLLKDKFDERFKELHTLQATTTLRPIRRTPSEGLLRRRAVDSDSEDDNAVDSQESADPCLAEFERYINTVEAIDADVNVVEWWGFNAHRYPTWASLARDYLAIMASSVSSERSFSSAGITISKRRNRLKGDIVEALQCLKCLYHNDLIFREVLTSAEVEKEMDLLEETLDKAATSFEAQDALSWDKIIVDADGDDSDVELLE